MKTISFSIPTLSDAKALWAKAQARNALRAAKREARRLIAAERNQRLRDLAAEILKATRS